MATITIGDLNKLELSELKTLIELVEKTNRNNIRAKADHIEKEEKELISDVSSLSSVRTKKKSYKRSTEPKWDKSMDNVFEQIQAKLAAAYKAKDKSVTFAQLYKEITGNNNVTGRYDKYYAYCKRKAKGTYINRWVKPYSKSRKQITFRKKLSEKAYTNPFLVWKNQKITEVCKAKSLSAAKCIKYLAQIWNTSGRNVIEANKILKIDLYSEFPQLKNVNDVQKGYLREATDAIVKDMTKWIRYDVDGVYLGLEKEAWFDFCQSFIMESDKIAGHLNVANKFVAENLNGITAIRYKAKPHFG